ncbi:hypothetical protein AKJ09_09385 [Labilithrix luteola]|uniref:Uncharacterized protein n=1 Tax=Labilithrix luteola TaxID=1391654 RepID=A0A0K1QAN8_9BACT|nr:hypothetical protein [Labilithrix luteola]AKV02722.1 hypothetical protein AKJ09_09385 [Labilithrix luteola]
MARLMLVVRALGLLFGGFVAFVGAMSVGGLLTDNVWVRLVVAVVLVIGVPAFLADRVLKRFAGGMSLVVDVFAIVLLGMALMFVSADSMLKGMLTREGDRFARSGSRSMARATYFIAGVAPVFPEEKDGGAPDAAASASASGSASGASSAPNAAPSK